MFAAAYNYLYKNPTVGFISGILSGAILQIRSMLTDELLLKEIAGIGIWSSAVVGALSVIIYGIKLYDIILIRIKRFKDKKHETTV